MSTAIPMPMQRGFVLLLAFALALGALLPLAAPSPTRAAPTELFFSEYIEGSSNNKALEIYNGTGAAVDLAAGDYEVWQYSNGASSPQVVADLTGTVVSGDVFVLAHLLASFANSADQTTSAGLFNGDDAVALVKADVLVDVIGQIGVDPGAEWGSGLTSTMDNTLRRKAHIEIGDADGTDVFDPAIEWDGFANDTFGGLGSHTTTEAQPVIADCGAPLTTPQGVAASTTVSSSDGDGTVTAIAIDTVDPAPAAGTVSVTEQTPAPAVGGTATATITVDAEVPPGTYAVSVEATNSDDPPQTGGCTLDVTVEGDGGSTAGIVISQLYGGGGNSGSTLTNDFIELFNVSGAAISIDGWTVQYASAAGTSWQVTAIGGSIPAGGYYLVQEAQGSGGTQPLPTPDAIGSIPMSATGGKVALVADTSPLSGTCPLAGAVDLVGFGSTASCFEGTGPTPAPSNTNAVLRDDDGCTDTDDNAGDFMAVVAAPRNSASPLNPCDGTADAAPTVASTTPADGAVNVANDASLDVTFSEAVDVADGWFAIECTTSGAHTAVVTGGPTAFTLDPDSDFADGDSCTVTIDAASVTDVDTDDPPDTMAAEHVFTFGVGSVCAVPSNFIYEVQGDSATTPISGQAVVVRGVVTADFTSGGNTGIPANQGLRGFFLEALTDDRDADPQTSEGVFVFDGGATFTGDIGDVVFVVGTAGEFGGVTQITASEIGACDEIVADLPEAAHLPLPLHPDDRAEVFEPLEAMRVTHEELTVIEFFQVERFGEIRLSADGVLQTPTNVELPGSPEAVQLAADNAAANIVLDDGRTGQNLNRLDSDDLLPYVAAGETLRIGDQLRDHTTILHFGFGVWRLQPVDIDAITAELADNRTRPRPEEPPTVGGTLQVASFNVLNYFDGDGQGTFPTTRGATTASEFARQTEKLVDAITRLDADIYGLIEIENDGGEFQATSTLVNALNAEMGAEVYRFVDTGVIGTDEIKQAFIYDRRSVRPTGEWAILTSEVDPRFDDTRSRPALAQTFTQLGTGERVTVVVNHFKSKGQSGMNDPSDPDFDQGDGQGFWNATRTASAEALADWLATNPTGVQSLGTLIIGDLNAYGREDPIRALEDAGFVDQLVEHTDGIPYSFTFDGMQGTLDTALVRSDLESRVTGAAVWHINADEVPAIDYQESVGVSFNQRFRTAEVAVAYYDPSAFRSSDHDPVLIGLNLGRRTFGLPPGN